MRIRDENIVVKTMYEGERQGYSRKDNARGRETTLLQYKDIGEKTKDEDERREYSRKDNE